MEKENTELSRFIISAPTGTIFTNAWLERHDISAKLAWWYVRTGLLKRLGAKAYKKPKISLKGIANAIT